MISFSIDKKMSEYTAGKSKYTSIEIDMVFSQYQADFISRVYKEIQTAIDDGLVKAGMALVNAKSFNIPV